MRNLRMFWFLIFNISAWGLLITQILGCTVYDEDHIARRKLEDMYNQIKIGEDYHDVLKCIGDGFCSDPNAATQIYSHPFMFVNDLHLKVKHNVLFTNGVTLAVIHNVSIDCAC